MTQSLTVDAEWWRAVALMDRKALVDELFRERELRGDALDAAQIAAAETEALQKIVNEREKLRDSVFVAATAQEAALSKSRLGIDKRVTYVLTNSIEGGNLLRGRKLEPEHVLMVPGWGRGQYAEELKEALAISGVNWANMRYAPSPETDRAEGLSNWGRTEAAIVDDTLGTLNDLLSRTLERTAEKPVGTKTGRMSCSEPNLSSNARIWGVVGTHG